MLQDKIVAGTKKATDVLRHAYCMFGRPQDGITAESFKHQVRQLGIPATNEDCRKLFKRYDTDGNGRLDFYEFINNLMPKDYPSKPWYQKRGEQDGMKLTLRRQNRNKKVLCMIRSDILHPYKRTDYQFKKLREHCLKN